MKVAVILIAILGAASAANNFGNKLGVRTALNTASGRIVGGEAARAGEFPWQVSIQVIFLGEPLHNCGGTVYSDTKIITAAHCVRGYAKESMRIVAGAHDILNLDGTEQIRSISSTEYHEEFDPNQFGNDVGIITLTQPLIFNSRVQPIRIAGTTFVASGEAVNSGWGNVAGDGSVQMPALLQKVNLEIVDRETCREDMSVIGGNVDDSMICASASGKGACNGDSGGPLVCKDEAGRQYLCGVVSWGVLPCATTGFHSVYSNVANLRPWLESKLNP